MVLRLGAPLGLLALGACSLAPEYQAPTTAQPPAFTESELAAQGAWQPAAPSDAQSRGAWWAHFGDAQLDALQTQLPQASQDLRAAVARYQQARALAGYARAGLYPQLDAGASLTRAQESESVSGQHESPGNTFSASAGLSWEIDLFGRLRNAADAQQQRLRASAGDLASTQLSLQAELATQYFTLRGAEATYALLEDSEQAYARALGIVQRRYDGGIAAATDVDQAQAQLESVRAQMAAVRLQRAQLQHGIAVLLGQPPSGYALPEGRFVGAPPLIDAGLPSTLLERRPDIAAAERRVAAANADLGVARAAWFPVFSLGANGGYAAGSFSDWFDAPSRFWSIGPAVSLPIFDGGARAALRDQALAVHEEAVASYRQSVLVAFQEVEDNLAALRHLDEEARSDDAAAEAAKRSAFHALRRYEAGVADYLEVTSTQTASLLAQRAALDARVRRVNAGVALVRALGGGWTADQLDAPQLAASGDDGTGNASP